jgi:ferredoxin-thioredoxin reductase catalytic chain
MSDEQITDADVEAAYLKLQRETESAGDFLNPDGIFTRQILRGLLTNQARLGYQACPCRFASGIRAEDVDIICPCDYRDSDLAQYDTCY